MYGLILGLCFVISLLDVCLLTSKKKFATNSERELADLEQMEYLEKWNRERMYR